MEIREIRLQEVEGNLVEYTGLKDCDGREIWESDIVTVLNVPDGRDPNVVVQFKAGMFGFFLEEEPGGLTFYPLGRFAGKYVRRAGNFFENPELLTKEAQEAAHRTMYRVDQDSQ